MQTESRISYACTGSATVRWVSCADSVIGRPARDRFEPCPVPLHLAIRLMRTHLEFGNLRPKEIYGNRANQFFQ